MPALIVFFFFLVPSAGIDGARVRPDPPGEAAQVLHLCAGTPDATAQRRSPHDPGETLVRRRQRHPVRILPEKGD